MLSLPDGRQVSIARGTSVKRRCTALLGESTPVFRVLPFDSYLPRVLDAQLTLSAAFKKFNTRADAQAFINSKRSRNPYAKPATVAAAKDPPSGQSASNGTTRITVTKPNGASQSATSSGRGRAESPVSKAADADTLSPALAELSKDGWMFTTSDPPRLIVYTDGSSLGNGKRGAAAGAGVYWGGGKASAYNLAERVPGKLQTNNRGELLVSRRKLGSSFLQLTCSPSSEPLRHVPSPTCRLRFGRTRSTRFKVRNRTPSLHLARTC